jgi:hypothetical protein
MPFAAEKEDLRILAPGETLETWEASFFAGSLLVKHLGPLPQGRRESALNPFAGPPVRNSGLDHVVVFLGEDAALAQIYAPLPGRRELMLPSRATPVSNSWAVVPFESVFRRREDYVDWKARRVRVLPVNIETYAGALERYAAALK